MERDRADPSDGRGRTDRLAHASPITGISIFSGGNGTERNGAERSRRGGELFLHEPHPNEPAGAGGRGRSSRVGDGTNQSKDGRHIWVSLEGQWPMDENGGRCTMPKAIGTSLGYVALVLAVEVGGIREQRPRGATAREDARRGEQRRGEGESMH